MAANYQAEQARIWRKLNWLKPQIQGAIVRGDSRELEQFLDELSVLTNELFTLAHEESRRRKRHAPLAWVQGALARLLRPLGAAFRRWFS